MLFRISKEFVDGLISEMGKDSSIIDQLNNIITGSFILFNHGNKRVDDFDIDYNNCLLLRIISSNSSYTIYFSGEVNYISAEDKLTYIFPNDVKYNGSTDISEKNIILSILNTLYTDVYKLVNVDDGKTYNLSELSIPFQMKFLKCYFTKYGVSFYV